MILCFIKLGSDIWFDKLLPTIQFPLHKCNNDDIM